jgi:hypothetical protein
MAHSSGTRLLILSVLFLFPALFALILSAPAPARASNVIDPRARENSQPPLRPQNAPGVLLSEIMDHRQPPLGNTPLLPDSVRTHAQLSQTMVGLPIQFAGNVGQADSMVRYTTRGAGYTAFFTNDEVIFSSRRDTLGRTEYEEGVIVRQRYLGANSNLVIEGMQPMHGTLNFIMGDDPTKWNTNIPTFGQVIYHNLYSGVDLIYSGANGQLKSEFVITPGTSPELIQIVYSGASGIYIREDGALVLETPLGNLVDQAPVAYQNIADIRVPVNANFRLANSETGSYIVSFEVGSHDPDYPLVIDPEWTFSTYLGGSSDDYGIGIAVDNTGNIYVSGYTNSSNFPTRYAISNTLSGGYDIFVTKIITASGAYTYGYSTYLGGNSNDYALKIAIDDAGNTYLTGYTSSNNFPTLYL